MDKLDQLSKLKKILTGKKEVGLMYISLQISDVTEMVDIIEQQSACIEKLIEAIKKIEVEDE